MLAILSHIHLGNKVLSLRTPLSQRVVDFKTLIAYCQWA